MDGASRMTTLARYILAALALGLLIFTIIWLIFWRDNGDSIKPVKNESSQTAKNERRAIEESKPKPKPTQTADNSDDTTPPKPETTPTTNRGTAGAAATGAGSTTSQSVQNPQQLANSGPGETLGLFALVVIAATLAKHWHLRRTAQN